MIYVELDPVLIEHGRPADAKSFEIVGVPVQRGYPANMPLTSARQVTGPTMPSTVTAGTSSESACWKPRTASSVRGPKIPST